jgi:nitrite reductase (NO-forming)
MNGKSPHIFRITVLIVVLAVFTAACGSGQIVSELNPEESRTGERVALAAGEQTDHTEADVKFTLRTELGSSGMVFVGVGGDIDGIINPDLMVNAGSRVEITLVNGDGMQHDIALPDLNADSEFISEKGSSTVLVFEAAEEGEFVYYCTVPGHRQAGMEGLLIVGDVIAQEAVSAPSIALDPANLPGPIGSRPQQHHELVIETIELEGHLAGGASFTYWTFDGTVPGPFLRIKVGDTVDVSLVNPPDSTMTHSIDFHAVTGPGGGAAVTQAAPGETKSFSFKALNPGLYVYHCATPMVAHHIANGMYGLILVEPEDGLPEVDREFYVMQGEIYTGGALGERGRQEISIEKLLDERPEYFVFNGSVGALTDEYPMKANVGETVRIYFGVGGPNFISSFHVIGEIFDKVYDQASLTSPPLTDVQTALVAPGGASVVEFTLEVPGRYILVDHALSRAERGLVGFLEVEGKDNPEIFHSDEEIGAGH